ncbi:uncharacterized protein Z518_00781 [Rhinocladiella mackenziei CBS 650.93]|uniref:Rhinocladiella mackenziei CBS 650.93 unplaced genomic scaffold supercont1.1, whole genome shotgun sequence n=1 Tax=Rhinocladiella mackenziei CBS 650.93 TaxID=1442369 RepID=A0A0D2JJR0_9EURO|nr:uncharacterized protein Z518_00781 [Rhinocladiella mackenziei CBS 650.93]KIX09700.1 hypothetical protein Z518_00781 [Rhinocladiella mackenziei CBS 650.93]
MQPIGPLPSDTYRTASLLLKLLPDDLVPVVLDMAEFWHDAPLASTTKEVHVTERNAGQPYLIAELLPVFPARGLRSLTFTVTSRDQGHSWDRHWHGTYEHSWTWFEVALLPSDSDNRTNDTGIKSPIPGKRIITNVHASNEYRTHVVRWSYNDDEEETRKLVRSIRAGQKIAITVWARFPAWVNNVRSARIDCQVNAVRKI